MLSFLRRIATGEKGRYYRLVGLVMLRKILLGAENVNHYCFYRFYVVHPTIRGELVEPPATHTVPFDKLRANGFLREQHAVTSVFCDLRCFPL
jgi:hypothetical protein